ncbi:MAG: hypothetical protein HONBIEJF_02595 [Fimbriimonadaceae bacterium]|nr:hypothetical protein [Fimbriimonadaceae bacterium]
MRNGISESNLESWNGSFEQSAIQKIDYGIHIASTQNMDWCSSVSIRNVLMYYDVPFTTESDKYGTLFFVPRSKAEYADRANQVLKMHSAATLYPNPYVRRHTLKWTRFDVDGGFSHLETKMRLRYPHLSQADWSLLEQKAKAMHARRIVSCRIAERAYLDPDLRERRGSDVEVVARTRLARKASILCVIRFQTDNAGQIRSLHVYHSRDNPDWDLGQKK